MKEQWNESTATAKGLYDPSFEHDNCGIGAVVNIKGIKTHQTVENALKIVENLKHRAGKDADGKTGDGVGILLQISHKFFKKATEPLGIKLGEERDYGVGMFFFPQDELKTNQAKKMFEVIVEKEGMEFLGWRQVPIHPDKLSDKARGCMPCIIILYHGIDHKEEGKMELQLVKKYDARAWDGVVVPLGEGNLNSYQGPWEQELAAVRASGRFEGKPGEIFRFSVLSEGVLTQIFLLGLGKDWSLEQVLESCAKVYRQCQELDLRAVCTDLRGVCPQFTPALFQKAAEAAALTGYRFDKYKTTPAAPGIETAAFLCEMPERYEAALVEAEVSAEATCIARDLINEPPTVLTPAKLAQAAQELFKETPVKVTVYGRDEVERIGLTAFLEVGKGSIYEPKLIVMEYTGAQDVESRLGLIGKGLTYDSGGYSLQSSEFMETMQHDMSGAAAVMGALWATQKRGLRINITGVVAACENKLSATAYVPGDVIRSMSGRYIEVNNTDAEGRITLADAVTYTKQCCGVDRIVDIATLTDGIQTALGNRRCGAFTNNRALTAQVEKGAAAACERMWELPCDENLRRVLDSRVAHLKNSAMGSSVGGYATVGAMFVKEFVEETPWVHLDIGGTAWTTECEGIYTKGGIGFGTRMLYETFKVMEKEGTQI